MHDETKWKGKYRIPSARKKGWDYSSASWYFITINAYAKSPPFGEVRDGEMFRNDLGESVARNWLLTLDEYADVVFDECSHAAWLVIESGYCILKVETFGGLL